MSLPKEKRTKEQMMRLLDRAIEQEEALLEKIKVLESELIDCRKKAENPRHELDEQALPGSKVSFRLDFYRTESHGPNKGIIEHLPTRESRVFEEPGFEMAYEFVTKFLGTAALPLKTSAHSTVNATPFPPNIREPQVMEEKKERSPLLQKLFPEIFGAPGLARLKPLETATDITEASLAQQIFEPMMVLTADTETNQRSIRSGQAFQIGISMHGLNEFQNKPCSVKLRAIPLEKSDATFEITEAITPNTQFLRIPVRNFTLDSGVYRLEMSMIILDEPQPTNHQETRLLIVQ